MRQIFKSAADEQFFRDKGYFIFDLLHADQIEHILEFYKKEFTEKREVFSYAKNLPYYISIFDANAEHKRQTDQLISGYVSPGLSKTMIDYEVYYSNFMIKFPGDGQIEAHQDFNFVDESVFTACNLWCPLVDTGMHNGGLYVIAGSHKVFRSQRGVNLPQSLTQYNKMLQRYGRLIPLKKGQAIIFDHKLVHYSRPNNSEEARVAIQSVLKPVESPACHCYYNQQSGKVRLSRIDKEFIFNNDLWGGSVATLPTILEEDLIPFPTEEEVINKLVQLKLDFIELPLNRKLHRMFINEADQQNFEENGFLKLSLLPSTEVEQLKEVFVKFTGGNVSNSDYGMYISLEEEDPHLKKELATTISGIVYPSINKYFINCKPHLGSFLVKAGDPNAYTYPHQDWTFVDSPPYCSITIWIALVDTDEDNGTLGFVKGSQWFFDSPVGSPSPEYKTCTQDHGKLFYQYLQFVPLKAGEAIAFDNRTIHGATPNTSPSPRIAVAVGVTPKEANLYHYYLVPQELSPGKRSIAKLKVNDDFFHKYSLKNLKRLYGDNELPAGYDIEKILDDEPINFSAKEMETFCERSGLKKNGKQLIPFDLPIPSIKSRSNTYQPKKINAFFSIKQFVTKFLSHSRNGNTI